MKLVISTIPTLLGISISALLSVSASSEEAKGMIRRNARTEEGSGEPEVADIFNGVPTGKALPYQVGLSQLENAIPECGGSLIAPRVVMTAAHCYMGSDGFDPSLSTVQVNMYDSSSRRGVGNINLSSAKLGIDIFVHPDFDPMAPTPYFSGGDIALVILPFDVSEGDNIKYAKLNEDPNVPAVDERMYISGWGKTSPSNGGSEILLGTVTNYLSGEDYVSDFAPFSNCKPLDECIDFFNTEKIAAYTKGTNVCPGDSGGPLVIASQDETAPATEPPLQVGLVSFTFGSCGEEYAAIYTRVSHHVDWIKSTACEAVGQLCSSSKSGKSSRSGCGNSKASKSQVLPSVSAEEDVAAVHDEMNI